MFSLARRTPGLQLTIIKRPKAAIARIWLPCYWVGRQPSTIRFAFASGSRKSCPPPRPRVGFGRLQIGQRANEPMGCSGDLGGIPLLRRDVQAVEQFGNSVKESFAIFLKNLGLPWHRLRAASPSNTVWVSTPTTFAAWKKRNATNQPVMFIPSRPPNRQWRSPLCGYIRRKPPRGSFTFSSRQASSHGCSFVWLAAEGLLLHPSTVSPPLLGLKPATAFHNPTPTAAPITPWIKLIGASTRAASRVVTLKKGIVRPNAG